MRKHRHTRALSWALGLLVLFSAAAMPADEPQPADDHGEPAKIVKGIVVDEAGQALAGAKVESLYEWERAGTVANDDGSFTLDLPRKPRQVLLLRAAEPGGSRLAFAAYLVDEKVRYMLDRYIAHVEIGIPREIKLVARRPRRIDVVVVNGDNQPLANANVFVSATEYQKIAQAETDAEGKATLRVPVDAPLYATVAMKPGVGLDYFLYQRPAPNKRDRYRLPRDRAEPLTLVLHGARRVTAKVIDESSQPLPGVTIFPWYLEKPLKGADREFVTNLFDGGALDTSRIADFRATTNEAGRASLDWVPVDCTESISIQTSAPEHITYESTYVAAGSADAEATIQLERAIRLRGQVTFNDGRAAPGAWVSLYQDPIDDGRDSGPRSGRWLAARTDDQGAFQISVLPNHFQVLSVSLDHWAAPIKTRVLLQDAPDEERIVLQKATRIHGRVTAGANNLPVASHRLGVFRRMEAEYRQFGERGMRLKPATRRGRAAPEPDAKLVVDGKGTALDRAIAMNLKLDDHYDAERVLAFLTRWKPGGVADADVRPMPRRARPNGGRVQQNR